MSMKIKEEMDRQIRQIKSSGVIEPQAKIYEDFNRYANTFDLDVVFTVFNDASTSHASINTKDGGYEAVSVLTLMVKYTQTLVNNEINLNDSNWSGRYIHTQELIAKWHYLLKAYNYPAEYKTTSVLVFIRSFEEMALVNLVRLCKNEIGEWIREERMQPIPEFKGIDWKIVLDTY